MKADVNKNLVGLLHESKQTNLKSLADISRENKQQ